MKTEKNRLNKTMTGHGAKRQIFGCVLLSVGLLDSMLTLKGGLGPDAYNFVMMLFGAIFLASGIRARGG